MLEGEGPKDLIEITLALAQEMLDLSNVDLDPGEVLASGKPREVFEKMVLGDIVTGVISMKLLDQVYKSESPFW